MVVGGRVEQRARAGALALALALATATAAILVGGCGPVAELVSDRADAVAATGDGDLLPDGTEVTLVYERRADLGPAGSGTTTTTVTFRVEIAGDDLSSGELILPDGTRLALEPGAPTNKLDPRIRRLRFEAEDNEPALLAAFPQGRYTIEVERDDGRRAALTVAALGDLPPAPVLLIPPDGAIGVALEPRFEWSGPFVRYDAWLLDEQSGAATRLASGASDLAASAAAPLEPGRRYRVELTARSGAPLGVAEYRSTIVSRFQTVEGGR